MTKCLLVGDWHGSTEWAESVLDFAKSQEITHVFHAGDFGIWPGYTGGLFLGSMIRKCQENGITLWVTPGNHEDYSKIEDPETEDGSVPDRQVLAGDTDSEGWEIALLPRGYRWDFGGLSFLSFGGAPSIDYEHRTKDVSWWSEEMIRFSDLMRLPEERVDVMICHDAPDGGTTEVQAIIDTPPHLSMWSEAGLSYARDGRMLMNKAVNAVKPRMFVHGHFHAPGFRYDKENDCSYLSLGMNGDPANVVVFDTDEFVRNDEPKEVK